MIRSLIIILISFYSLTALSQQKDSTRTLVVELGINLTKSEILFYKTCGCSTFLQDVPDNVGKQYAFSNNHYTRYDEEIWLNKSDADLLTVYPLNKQVPIKLNLQIKLSYKKLELISYLNYYNQILLLRSPVKNDNIRNYVYQLNPNYEVKYQPYNWQGGFQLYSPATVKREDSNKLSFQFFLKKKRNKKFQFSVLPGIDLQILLKQKVYYYINENDIKNQNLVPGYSYYKDEKKYFKVYSLSPLLNAALSYKLTDKLKINANAIYQIRPIWQTNNALETIKTSRIGAGIGLSYIIERKKCKVCPTE